MSYYLLNHLSTAVLVLVVVGVPALAAVVVVLIAERTLPRLQAIEFDDGVREVVGLVFGLLLALVIAAVATKMDDADSTVASEATATAQVARAARAFALPDQQKLERSIGQYVHAVVEREWPAMRDGEKSAVASAAIETLYGTFQRLQPKSEPRVSVYRQALVQLDRINEGRRERLDLSSQELPGLLRALLIFGAISFIVLSYPTAVEGLRRKIAIVASITAFVSFCYLLTIVLDHPFSGDLAISNEPFKEGDLAFYWADLTPSNVPDADLVPVTARDVTGVWASDAFGPVVFRRSGDRLLGALRLGRATVIANVSDGVVRASWCEAPTRAPPGDAGLVEWRMTRSGGPDRLVGDWRYGTSGAVQGGWDLERIGGPQLEPPDIVDLFDQPSRFCPPLPAKDRGG